MLIHASMLFYMSLDECVSCEKHLYIGKNLVEARLETSAPLNYFIHFLSIVYEALIYLKQVALQIGELWESFLNVLGMYVSIAILLKLIFIPAPKTCLPLGKVGTYSIVQHLN